MLRSADSRPRARATRQNAPATATQLHCHRTRLAERGANTLRRAPNEGLWAPVSVSTPKSSRRVPCKRIDHLRGHPRSARERAEHVLEVGGLHCLVTQACSCWIALARPAAAPAKLVQPQRLGVAVGELHFMQVAQGRQHEVVEMDGQPVVVALDTGCVQGRRNAPLDPTSDPPRTVIVGSACFIAG